MSSDSKRFISKRLQINHPLSVMSTSFDLQAFFAAKNATKSKLSTAIGSSIDDLLQQILEHSLVNDTRRLLLLEETKDAAKQKVTGELARTIDDIVKFTFDRFFLSSSQSEDAKCTLSTIESTAAQEQVIVKVEPKEEPKVEEQNLTETDSNVEGSLSKVSQDLATQHKHSSTPIPGPSVSSEEGEVCADDSTKLETDRQNCLELNSISSTESSASDLTFGCALPPADQVPETSTKKSCWNVVASKQNTERSDSVPSPQKTSSIEEQEKTFGKSHWKPISFTVKPSSSRFLKATEFNLESAKPKGNVKLKILAPESTKRQFDSKENHDDRSKRHRRVSPPSSRARGRSVDRDKRGRRSLASRARGRSASTERVRTFGPGSLVQYIAINYWCTVDNCKAVFAKEIDLRSHKEKRHKDLPFKCLEDDCKKSFWERYRILAHLNEDHPRRDLWSCFCCDYKAFQPAAVYTHMFIHHQKGEFKCARGCPKVYRKAAGAIDHFERRH